MSQKTPIGTVDLRAFAHATEDPEKVLTAMRNLLPMDLAETVTFEKNSLTGHHGNAITVFTTQVAKKFFFPALLENFGQTLNALDKENLNSNLDAHIEKTNLYLRFDKQAAFLGKIKFTQDDPICVKLHFKSRPSEEIINILKTFELLP